MIEAVRAPGHVTAILKAENRQKMDKIEPVYLRSADIDKKILVRSQTD